MAKRRKWRAAWMYRPTVRIRLPRIADRAVEELHKQVEEGEPEALLYAIDYCIRAGIELPEWLAQAWCDCFERWVTYRAGSLDDAFGVKRKGKHLNVQRRNTRLRPWIVSRVLQLSGEGVKPIKIVFDRVAEEIRNHPDGDTIFGDTVKEIYFQPASKAWCHLFEALQRHSKKTA